MEIAGAWFSIHSVGWRRPSVGLARLKMKPIRAMPREEDEPCLALCFLVTRDVENLDLWRDWMAGNEHMVNVYVHISPDKDAALTSPFLRARRIRGAVPTAWGTTSLVKAQGRLYRAARANPRNAFFFIASETCIPIRGFRHVWSRLMASPEKGIGDFTSWGADLCASGARVEASVDCSAPCIARMRALGVIGRRNNFFQMPQWTVLSRQNTEDFLEMLRRDNEAWFTAFTECQVVAPEQVAPDETMFINYLVHKYGRVSDIPFRRGTVTAAYFLDDDHPVTFRDRDDLQGTCILQEACDTNAMFARKFLRLGSQEFEEPRCPRARMRACDND